MTKFIINGKATTFKSNPEISIGKKFVPVRSNLISMLPAILVRVDSKYYALEDPIIVWTQESIDFIVNKNPQEVSSVPADYKKTLKNLKKIISQYEGKFQFGLEYSDLEMLSDAKAAFMKYKLLNRFGFSIKGGAHD